MRKRKTAADVADLIDRFLNDAGARPQEWNDFVECTEPDPRLEVYRKRCELLGPLVNSPAPLDPDAIAELKGMVKELRYLEVAETLQNFLDGTGGKWDWGDFISATHFEDSYLEKIRVRCALLDQEFPPTIRGRYCNEQGLEVIRAYIRELTKSK
jgi:hypothetical protein